MPSKKILIVEDDKNIIKLLRYNLEKIGFICFSVITGEEAMDVLDKEDIDLILLDIMLPKMDGIETCKKIKSKERFVYIPMIFLTAKGSEIDRVLGLELGADDYIVKPFSPRELIPRIKVVLNRGKQAESPKEIFSAREIKIDLPRHKVTVGNKEVKLTSMEFKLLSVLVERKGRVQSRDTLLNDVWGFSADVTTRTVDTHIKLLRQKLGKSGKLIETVRGFGYKIKDE